MWRFFHKTSSGSRAKGSTRHIILIVPDERSGDERLSPTLSSFPKEKHTIKKKKCHAKSGTAWIEQAFGKCFETAPQADKDEFQNAASRFLI
jgi:hypothetical protein